MHVAELLEWIPPAPKHFTKQQRLAWKGLLEAYGYSFTINILNASEFGVPQERERVLMVGSLKRRIPAVISPKLATRTAWEIIDWDSGNWFDVKGKAAATVAWWESGRARYGHRFVMPYYGSRSNLTKQLGNAVPPPFAAEVLRQLLAA